MNKWSEILSDYIEENLDSENDEKPHVVNYIDAWLTSDDEEEGSTIAKIKLSFHDSQNSFNTEVHYIDEDAFSDPSAQEVISEAILDLIKNYGQLLWKLETESNK